MSEELRKEEIYIESGPYSAADFYKKTGDALAELVNGNIVMLAAPSMEHRRILTDISTDINVFIRKNSGDCSIFVAPFDVRLNDKNVFEPDITIICDKNKITDKGCDGAPDFVIEIVSPSTARNDYLRKLNAYGDSGVKEYWIVDPQKKQVYVYIFETGYAPTTYDFKDCIPVWIFDEKLELTIEQ